MVADELAKAMDEEQLATVVRVLSALSTRRGAAYHAETFRILARVRLEGASLRMIAEEMGVNPTAISDRLKRAERLLRAKGLWPGGGEPGGEPGEEPGGDAARIPPVILLESGEVPSRHV
jgi:hypothetical protein